MLFDGTLVTAVTKEEKNSPRINVMIDQLLLSAIDLADIEQPDTPRGR